MSKRLSILAATLGAALMLLAVVPIASASAAEPWWQVTSGSRPTNMWEPTDNVQEITSEEAFGVLVAPLEVKGKVVGCLGAGSYFGIYSADELCNIFGYAPQATETASELEALLEGVYKTSVVEVTGGPAGAAPFVIKVPKLAVPAITIPPTFFGTASAKVLSLGGSGRIVATLTNLGDASVDGAGTPVRIVDELPQGVIAGGAEAVAGRNNAYGPVECTVEAPTEVVCEFDGELPPFEAIEVEVLASLTGSPPNSGTPGRITVAGGTAAPASAPQAIHVSPEPTPFGIEQFSAVSEEEGGHPASRAGGHPFQLTTTLQLNSGHVSGATRRLEVIEQPAMPRNLSFLLPAGLVGNLASRPTCPMVTFLRRTSGGERNACPADTAIGVSSVTIDEPLAFGPVRMAVPVFDLAPARGEPARFGFMAVGNPVIVDTAVDPTDRYRIIARVTNTTELVEFLSATTTIWGAPGDSRHDNARGWDCVYAIKEGPCQHSDSLDQDAVLRDPVQCSSPLDFELFAEPWNRPIGSLVDTKSAPSEALMGCNQVPFDPAISSSSTSKLAENPSGLDFQLNMPNSGLLNKDGIAEAQPKKVVVTLPEGVTINPSEGDGLVPCNKEEYARETASSRPGEGCPEASKIGTVQVSTPLLEEELKGALYVATPYENQFGSLIALYLVAKAPDRGVIVKLAGKVEPDLSTGQLVTTFDELPQLPFSVFKLHFREGARAPLVTPPTCGSYQTLASFVPWSVQDPSSPLPNEIVTRSSSFTVERGVDGGACPSGGTPPFAPQALAGTQNNAAGSYSPFYLRVSRNDGEQEITGISTTLPPGLVGSLNGIPFCGEAEIQRARQQSGAEAETASACPAASKIGHTIAEAGVGGTLAQTPGGLYLGGPFAGAPFSIVSITSAKVGPFDLGTVVVHLPLKIDPRTAQVSIPQGPADQIPHIMKGIVIHLRALRVYIDREHFMLNPTSCNPMSISATLIGSGANFASAADDQPATVTNRFQAADCANLGFKPKFEVSTSAYHSRRDGASLTVRMTYPKGALGSMANLRSVKVKLPKQFPSRLSTLQKACPHQTFDVNPAECPAASIVGRALVHTSVLPVPLEGPAYFVSYGGEQFPKLILVLQGYGVTVELEGNTYIKNGVTSSTFRSTPDVPFESFELKLPQGPYSALSANGSLCKAAYGRTITQRVRRRVHGRMRTVRIRVRRNGGGLVMPTDLTGQNGKAIHENTKIAVTGCTRHKTRKARPHKTHH